MPKWVVAWIHNGDSPEVVAGKICDYPSWNIDDDNQVKRFNDHNDMFMYRDELINHGQMNRPTAVYKTCRIPTRRLQMP